MTMAYHHHRAAVLATLACLACLACVGVGVGAAGVDLTRVPGAAGADVVEAALHALQVHLVFFCVIKI